MPYFLGNRKGSHRFRVENGAVNKDWGWCRAAFFFPPGDTEIIRAAVSWFWKGFWFSLRLLFSELLPGMQNALKGKE